MEKQEKIERTPNEHTEATQRDALALEWIESDWFQVWLKLARGEYQQH